jgi:predicted lipid-binding transport protein (Tim44 family)
MLAYLGIPFTLCVLPLICYLVSRRLPRPGPPPGGRSFARVHAAQALTLSFTALLGTLCGLIVGGVLALDSLQVAVVIAVPLLALLWLSVLAVVVRSAIAASRGEFRPVPAGCG